MRAEYVPTADQRALVESAAAFGITQADIAEHEPVVGGRDKLDPACLAAKLVNLDKGQTEARDPKKPGNGCSCRVIGGQVRGTVSP